jgi:antitoxin (DNA-binding transcriptional repressor) of toxin-antitoxin stability system
VFPEQIRPGESKLREDSGTFILTGLTGHAIIEPMKVIAAYEAKSRFSELLREAAAGEVFIITRNGQKMAELRACQSEKPTRIRGMMKSEIPPIPADFNEPLDIFAEYQ